MLGRFKEVVKKYGKVAMGVHLSVSAASITGIYVAIKNNVDVESMLEKIGIANKKEGIDEKGGGEITKMPSNEVVLGGEITELPSEVKKNRTAEMVVGSGGAITVAVLLNKALFPVRVPITMVLTPAVARFLARRNLIKHSV